MTEKQIKPCKRCGSPLIYRGEYPDGITNDLDGTCEIGCYECGRIMCMAPDVDPVEVWNTAEVVDDD